MGQGQSESLYVHIWMNILINLVLLDTFVEIVASFMKIGIDLVDCARGEIECFFLVPRRVKSRSIKRQLVIHAHYIQQVVILVPGVERHIVRDVESEANMATIGCRGVMPGLVYYNSGFGRISLDFNGGLHE